MPPKPTEAMLFIPICEYSCDNNIFKYVQSCINLWNMSFRNLDVLYDLLGELKKMLSEATRIHDSSQAFIDHIMNFGLLVHQIKHSAPYINFRDDPMYVVYKLWSIVISVLTLSDFSFIHSNDGQWRFSWNRRIYIIIWRWAPPSRSLSKTVDIDIDIIQFGVLGRTYRNWWKVN